VLNKRLIYLRKNKKKTQEDLSNMIGVTRPAYTAYERGTRTPDYETLKFLASYYNVTTDYLLGISDTETNTDEKTDKEIKELMDEVNDWYKKNPENRKEKFKMLKKIIRTFTREE